MTKKLSSNVVQISHGSGIEQLGLVVSETKPYITEKLTFEEYKKQQISHNARDLVYNRKELLKGLERNKGRLETYLGVRTDIDKILRN